MKIKIEDEGDCSRITYIPENESELFICEWIKHQQFLAWYKEKHVSYGIDKSHIKEAEEQVREAKEYAKWRLSRDVGIRSD